MAVRTKNHQHLSTDIILSHHFECTCFFTDVNVNDLITEPPTNAHAHTHTPPIYLLRSLQMPTLMGGRSGTGQEACSWGSPSAEVLTVMQAVHMEGPCMLLVQCVLLMDRVDNTSFIQSHKATTLMVASQFFLSLNLPTHTATPSFILFLFLFLFHTFVSLLHLSWLLPLHRVIPYLVHHFCSKLPLNFSLPDHSTCTSATNKRTDQDFLVGHYPPTLQMAYKWEPMLNKYVTRVFLAILQTFVLCFLSQIEMPKMILKQCMTNSVVEHLRL